MKFRGNFILDLVGAKRIKQPIQLSICSNGVLCCYTSTELFTFMESEFNIVPPVKSKDTYAMICCDRMYGVLERTCKQWNVPFEKIRTDSSYVFYVGTNHEHYIDILRGWFVYLTYRCNIPQEEELIKHIKQSIRAEAAHRRTNGEGSKELKSN